MVEKEISDLVDDAKKKSAIESACLKLELEAKATRHKYWRYLVYTIIVVFFLVLGYVLSGGYQYYPNRPSIWTAFNLFDLMGLALVSSLIFVVIQKLVYPLSLTNRAFLKIENSIQTLEKSQEKVAYEDVYRNLESSLKNLKKLSLNFLRNLEWYSGTNKAINEFIEDLELIVLPSTLDSTIKNSDLKDIALALYSKNADELTAVNKILEKKYTKIESPKPETMWHDFSQTRLGKLVISLSLGYGLVLVISAIYVFATQQDFGVFARDRPDIIILGGLIVSGITFWGENRK